MLVKEVMSQELICVERTTSLRQLLKMFSKFHIFPLVPVIKKDKRLIGIVSFRNLIDAFSSYHPDVLKLVPFLDEEEEDIFRMDITEEVGDLVIMDDIMDKEFISIPEDTSLEEAYKLMRLHLKEEFPVVDKENRLVGMVGIFDLIRAVFREKGIIE